MALRQLALVALCMAGVSIAVNMCAGLSLHDTAETVGGFGALVATLLVAVTLLLQGKELRLQRKELRLQRDELRDSRSELARQASASEKLSQSLDNFQKATLLHLEVQISIQHHQNMELLFSKLPLHTEPGISDEARIERLEARMEANNEILESSKRITRLFKDIGGIAERAFGTSSAPPP